MSARLIGRTGKATGMDVPVPDKALIGAGPDAQIRVPVEGVSRSHARLWREGDSYWIEDGGSVNGTFVNGQRVTCLRLRHLDVITLGRDVDLLFLERAGGVAPVVRRVISDARIEWLDGPKAGGRLEVPRGELTLGRDWSCNVNVEHGAVSKVHARLQRSKGHLSIQDLGSTNGTRVNDRRVEGAHALEDGDVVSLGGKVGFRVRIETEAATSDAVEASMDTVMQKQVFDQEWRTRLIWSPEEMAEIDAFRAEMRSTRGDGGAEGEAREAPPAPPAARKEPAAERRPEAAAAGSASQDAVDAQATHVGEVPRQAPAAPDEVLAAARAAAGSAADRTQAGKIAPRAEDAPEGVLAAAARAAGGAPDRTQVAKAPAGGDAAVPDAVAAAASAARDRQEAGRGDEKRKAAGDRAAASSEAGARSKAAPKSKAAAKPKAPLEGPPAAGAPVGGPEAEEAARQPPRVELKLVDGDKVFTLEPGELTVGRDPKADVRINRPEISRAHAKIRVGAAGVTVEDLGSANGTTVNGRKLTGSAKVKDGDKIGFSRLEFELRIGGRAG